MARIRTDWRLLGPLLAGGVAGMVGGWYYYFDVGQFNPACTASNFGCPGFYQPVWLWPLVADSPNAVLLFFVAALAWKLRGWRSKWLDALAFTLNIYVGLWTAFLFLAFPARMGTFDWGSTNNILFFTHLGMPLQALTLLPTMRKDSWSWPLIGAMLAFLAFFVGVDYWGPHLHPAPFLHDSPSADHLLHAVSPWIMVAVAALWVVVVRRFTARAQPGTV